MIFGMSTFLFVHVLLSLIGIVSGYVVLVGLWRSDRMAGWSFVFLATTFLTCVTGFLFPITALTPALVVGVITTLALVVAIAARYRFRLAGRWRGAYVAGAMAALYLNSFVLVVQAFQKIPALNALAPQGSEPPFAMAQGALLLFFLIAGFRAFGRFHPGRFYPAQ